MAFSFKAMVEADRRRTFLNLDEFGEKHTVEGRAIAAVLDDNALKERQGGQELSVAESSLLLYAAVEDLPARRPAGEGLNATAASTSSTTGARTWGSPLWPSARLSPCRRCPMSIVNSIETVRDWLTAEVCPLVKLKLPDDNATDASYPYKLVNPAAFSLFVPSKDRTPPNIAAPIPSVCVQIVQGDDDLLQSARDIKIRLCFSAWDPGYHGPDIFKPKGDGSGTYIQQYNEAAASYFVKNGEGWRDAWNFVDTSLRLIENAEYLGDLRVIKEKGITFGPVTEQDAVPDFYPYWFAWAEFSIEETLTRNQKSYQHLL